MATGSPRRRVHIGTLMLLVVIAALSMALVVGHRRRIEGERRTAMQLERAALQAAESVGMTRQLRRRAEQAESRLNNALEEAKG